MAEKRLMSSRLPRLCFYREKEPKTTENGASKFPLEEAVPTSITTTHAPA